MFTEAWLWCAVGAIVGWGAGMLMRSEARSVRVEELLVGVFGAYSAAQMWVSYSPPAQPTAFNGLALVFAFVGSVALLLLLRVFRAVSANKPAVRRRRS
jgi:uncharacterized membrane protein YeaQ/YmgE (transglycosylase-associated protein family)